jgi:hypothetical protein
MKNDEFFLEHHIDAINTNCKILLVAPKSNKFETSENQLKVIGNELVVSKNAIWQN